MITNITRGLFIGAARLYVEHDNDGRSTLFMARDMVPDLQIPFREDPVRLIAALGEANARPGMFHESVDRFVVESIDGIHAGTLLSHGGVGLPRFIAFFKPQGVAELIAALRFRPVTGRRSPL